MSLITELPESHREIGLQTPLDLTQEPESTAVPETQELPQLKREPERLQVEALKEWRGHDVGKFVAACCDLPQYESTVEKNLTGARMQALRAAGFLNKGLLRAGICDHSHQRKIASAFTELEEGSPRHQQQNVDVCMRRWQARRDEELKRESNRTRLPPLAQWDPKRKELTCGNVTAMRMPGGGTKIVSSKLRQMRRASSETTLYTSEARKTYLQKASRLAGKEASMPSLVRW
mmetsp:Transcript_42274/g.79135  ORF Transcript_42274/g.79135 Transcript_42274/m.79135 type:complete len:233 (-) Transcript_42274:52-750(-)